MICFQQIIETDIEPPDCEAMVFSHVGDTSSCDIEGYPLCLLVWIRAKNEKEKKMADSF